MEKYISFSIGNLRFIDSYQFMSESLEKLVCNMQKQDFIHMATRFPPEKLDLMLRKGVFPYEYWDSPERMTETSLPPRRSFFSKLTGESCTLSNYWHAMKVWKTFELKTLVEYHDLYLTTDVLLLADVFEKFRKTCFETYHLDPAHYYSSPGLAWDAMLKMTGIELELVNDRELHDIIDKGIRQQIIIVIKFIYYCLEVDCSLQY